MADTSSDRFFANARVLGALDTEGRRRLLDGARMLEFGAGEVVVREGDPGDAMYLVVDGQAVVTIEDPAGPKLVAELGEGALFGEMAVITAQPRSATVSARGQLRVLRIAADVVKQVLEDYPRLKELIAKLGVSRSEQTLEKMLED